MNRIESYKRIESDERVTQQIGCNELIRFYGDITSCTCLTTAKSFERRNGDTDGGRRGAARSGAAHLRSDRRREKAKRNQPTV